jgi:transcriptional antiterminator RfaH
MVKIQLEDLSPPMAELWPDVTKPAWFCIRTHLKHEHIAAAHLCIIPGVEVFNPRLRMVRSTRRGPLCSTESLFPNYLFARFILESELEKVRYCPAVSKVLQFGDMVPIIPDAVIHALQRDLEGVEAIVLTDAPDEAEEVEVSAGALKGLIGRVIRVLPAKRRVEILLDLMGRSIAAELSLELVLFRRKDPANLILHEAADRTARGLDVHTVARSAESSNQATAR